MAVHIGISGWVEERTDIFKVHDRNKLLKRR
jgi:hypothetical protein